MNFENAAHVCQQQSTLFRFIHPLGIVLFVLAENNQHPPSRLTANMLDRSIPINPIEFRQMQVG
jgi:hypothetical protein